jgi:hypothetical protein
MIERTRRPIGAAMLALLGMTAADGLAGAIAVAQGTQEQQMACQSDAFRLCSQYIPDVTNVRACMVKNIRSLSPACRSQFTEGRTASASPSDPAVERHRPY